MAYIVPGSMRVPGSALNPYTEAQVEGALNILEQEAGLSEETMATLRQAVESGMSRRRDAAAAQQAIASAGYSMLQMMAPQGSTSQDLTGVVQGAGTPEQQAQAQAQAVQQAHQAGIAMQMGAVPSMGGVPPAPMMMPGVENPYAAFAGMIPRNVKPPSSKRQQLTVEEAAEIYKLRPGRGEARNGGLVHCRLLAPKYGVTPKTIRDVWSGRTWAEATRHLWTEEEKVAREKAKSKGAKQSDSEDGDAGPAEAGGESEGAAQQKRAKSDVSPSGPADESSAKKAKSADKSANGWIQQSVAPGAKGGGTAEAGAAQAVVAAQNAESEESAR